MDEPRYEVQFRRGDHTHAGRLRFPGEPYDATEREIRKLRKYDAIAARRYPFDPPEPESEPQPSEDPGPE